MTKALKAGGVFVPAFLVVTVAVVSLILLHADRRSSANAPEPAAYPLTLFYGDGCPHCANVEAFIARYNVTSTIPLAEREVYHNQQNAALLTQAASGCGLPTDAIGVPFLWNDGKCLVGDQPIIDFFKSKLGQQ